MQENPNGSRMAKLICIGLTVFGVLVFVPSLMVAGFSFYAIDHPGAGVARNLYVAFVMTVSMLMPVIAVAAPIFSWVSYRRQAYRRIKVATLLLLVFTALWLFPFSTVFFT